MTRAGDFLRRLLASGPVAATDGERQARAAGIGSRTLDRARRQLGVVASRGRDRWWWEWPSRSVAKDATPRATTAATPATVALQSPPRRIEDLRPGDLIEWNGRTWPFLGLAYRDGIPLVYFTCAEATGGIGCQPVWSVRPAKDAHG